MNNYITQGHIISLKKDIQRDLDEYKRDGRKVKYVITGEWRIILMYAIEILERIRQKIMKYGPFLLDDLLDMLSRQNWYKFSLEGYSLSSDKARERLGLRKTMSTVDVLYEQGAMLRKAGFYVRTLIEGV